ncbi:MAG: hypothetical protein Q9209_003152 [Squamulea sp. 1 TL-2023]
MAERKSLIQAANKLYDYINDVVHAREEQRKLLASLQGIADVLEAIKHREALAHQNPNDRWYKGFLALNNSATASTTSRTRIPDLTRKGDGALIRLENALVAMKTELKPKHGYAGFRQRWAWTHDKKKINDLVTQLVQLRSHVDSVLHQDRFQLSAAIQATGTDTNERVRDFQQTHTTLIDHVDSLKITGADAVHRLQELHIQGVNHVNRMNGLADNNTAIRITTDDTHAPIKRLEAADALKEQRDGRRAIIEWLSPLQFLRRQSDIFNGNIPLGEGFLKSDEFEAWSEVDRLRKMLKPAGVPVLCMYLNYKERNQTLKNLIGSLLKHLIQIEDDEFRSPLVRKFFREAAREAPPLLEDLYEALRAELLTFPR